MVRYQGDDSFPMKISKFISHNREISAGFLILMIVAVSVLVASNYSPKPIVEDFEQQANFVIASWDYPDQYGQGIDLLHFYENSTGSWLPAWFYIDGVGKFYTLHSYDSYDYFNFSAGVAMKIRVETLFNQTLVNVSSTAEGQKYLRHDVTVSDAYGVVFSQQNFTYYDVIEFGEDNYYYKYEVVLNFLPVSGEIYTVVVTYEIYY